MSNKVRIKPWRRDKHLESMAAAYWDNWGRGNGRDCGHMDESQRYVLGWPGREVMCMACAVELEAGPDRDDEYVCDLCGTEDNPGSNINLTRTTEDRQHMFVFTVHLCRACAVRQGVK